MNLEQISSKQSGQLLDRLSPRNVGVATKSDTVNLDKECYIALFDAADDGKLVKVMTAGGGVVTWTLTLNQIIPILVKRVYSTTTTATTVYTVV